MFFNRTKNLKRGYTIVEVMIASALFGIAGLALASVYLFSTRSFAAMANYAELDQMNRGAMDTMTREIRQAQMVMEPSPDAAGNIYSINLINFVGDSVTYTFNHSQGTLLRIAGN